MEDTYQYQLIKRSQLAEIGALYAECFNLADIGEHWEAVAAEQFLRYLYNIQPNLFFVCTKDEKIIGAIVGVIKPWCDGNHIHEIELFVHPNHQRRGIATRLTRLIVQTALEKYAITEFEGIADGSQHDFPLSWYKRMGVNPSGLIHIAGKPEAMLKNLTI